MLEVGSKALLCELFNQDGKLINLAKINKNIVLYFYPKDNTPGCKLEGREFSEIYQEFLKLNTIIFGVSKDTIQSHLNFKQKQCFSFDLLSDKDLVLAKSFDAWGEKTMFGIKYQGIHRKTFFINENKILIHKWEKFPVRGHAQEVLEFIKSNKQTA